MAHTNHINIGAYFKKEIQTSSPVLVNCWKQYFSDWLGHLLPVWQLMAGCPSHCQPEYFPDRTGCLSDPSAGSRAVLRMSGLRVWGSFWFFSLVLFKGEWGSIQRSVVSLGEGHTAQLFSLAHLRCLCVFFPELFITQPELSEGTSDFFE